MIGFDASGDVFGSEITDDEIEALMADEVAARTKMVHRVVIDCRNEAETRVAEKILLDAGFCPKVKNR